MAGQFYSAGAISSLPGWPLYFAREPDPGLDLELDEPGNVQQQPSPSRSPAPQKPPRLRILILILLLLIVAGGAYVAMNPDTAMKLIGQDQPMPTPAVRADRPAISPRSSEAPEAPRTMDPEAPDAVATLSTVPTPSFGEGQKVTAISNPDSPVAPLSLTQDAAGTKPGPAVNTATPLVVLDGELHDNAWVYLVRTGDGTKGWIPEKQLALLP